MLTLKTEAHLVDETLQKSGIKVIAKENVEKLVPEQGSHLIVIDDVSLVPTVEASLKDNGFVLLQSAVGASVPIEVPSFRLVALKISAQKQFHLFKKVCLLILEISR